MTTLPLTLDPVEQAKAGRRINVGCGQWPLLYWTNIDADPSAYADIYQSVPPLPFADDSLDEVYAGHFLEHLSETDASAFLIECRRVLVPGGRVGIVVPDTREILSRWLSGAQDRVEYPAGVWHDVSDLDAVCRLFLYSPIQNSPHLWSYDLGTLARLLTSCGLTVGAEIDRFGDPRIPVGAWYQMGLDAVKP